MPVTFITSAENKNFSVVKKKKPKNITGVEAKREQRVQPDRVVNAAILFLLDVGSSLRLCQKSSSGFKEACITDDRL